MPQVLIAEDNPDIQRIFHKAFQHAGFDVVIAADGIEAIQFMDKTLPDLLVLDINMPRASGIDVLDRLRKQNNLDKIHVIVVTGNTVAASSIDDTSVDLILVKPVSPLELVVLAERFISMIRV
jgi:two-component system, OmpR family, response regulator